MQVSEFELWPHPAYPSRSERRVSAQLMRRSMGLLELSYRVQGGLETLVIAPRAPIPRRADRLWESTCFELFIQPDGATDYLECNFAPSGDWAVYAFDAYRDGMRQAAVPGPPDIRFEARGDCLLVNVRLSLALTEEPYRFSMATILAEGVGARSFWAMSHTAGEPDFHRADCFVGELPSPARP